MSTSQIGVHLADHSFFPVFPDQTPGRRRVVFSTSRPDQECVDIVLYRRDPAFSESEERLGHILLCDLSPGDPEQSEIELVLDLSDDGTIVATAIDRRSGNRRDVAIDQRDAAPEFTEDDTHVAGDAREVVEKDGATRRKGWVIAFLLGLLLVAAIGFLGWWFLLREAPAGEHAVEPASGDAAVTGTAASGGVSDVTVADPTDTADSSPGEYALSASPAQAYRVRYGDTLWNISCTFYGTPWRFHDIAVENRISDPDRIYVEDEIMIP